MMLLLLGFTFFTATMWAGGTLGTAFSFSELLLVILVGNFLLALTLLWGTFASSGNNHTRKAMGICNASTQDCTTYKMHYCKNIYYRTI